MGVVHSKVEHVSLLMLIGSITGWDIGVSWLEVCLRVLG